MSQENVEIAKRAAEAYNRRDVDTSFAELATPDLARPPRMSEKPGLSRVFRSGPAWTRTRDLPIMSRQL